MTKITLPWPPKELSPNARLHWAKLAGAKKAYRETCYFVARQQKLAKIEADRLDVHFVFYPPTRRRIDLDNCISRMKAGIDAMALIVGVDDSRWRMSFEIADTVGSMVEVFFAPSGSETEPFGV
jgi:crossover junction endodeoxyribonuclease RusA